MYEELRQRVAENVRAQAPREHFVDVERYVSKQRFEDEQRYVFQRFPQVVGHTGMLPEPGACLSVQGLSVPLLLCRDDEGVLRGFFNVCRHRHTRLVSDQGVCKRTRLVCPYHGWSYDLAGNLLNIPLADGFPSIDKAQFGLIEVKLEEQFGVLYLLPRADAAVVGAEHLLPLAEHFEAFGLGDYAYFTHRYTQVSSNWKVIYDAFSEAYHVKRLHHETLADFFLDNMIVAERVGLHMCSAVARTEMSDAALAADPNVALQTKATFSYHIFPNSLLIISPDYVNMLVLYPQSPDQTLVLNMMFTPEQPTNAQAQDHWRRSFDLLDGAVFQGEDFHISEEVHVGLKARITSEFVSGRFENGIPIIHGIFDEVMAAERAKS